MQRYLCFAILVASVSLVSGQVGPTGPQGPQGVPGVQGTQGPQGIQGPQGNIGSQGIQGVQGSSGATGATGQNGSPGTPGQDIGWITPQNLNFPVQFVTGAPTYIPFEACVFLSSGTTINPSTTTVEDCSGEVYLTLNSDAQHSVSWSTANTTQPITLGQVSFLNTNPMIYSSGTFSQVMSIPSGGVDMVAIACIVYDDTPGLAITTVTYGGQAMTAASKSILNTNGDEYVSPYFLVNPPTGNNTLTINTFGAFHEIYSDLTTFAGVNQTTPVRPGSYTVSMSTGAFSLVIPSDPKDLTYSCVNSGGHSADSSQTLNDQSVMGHYAAQSDRATIPAANVTHTWTSGSTGAAWGFSIQHD